MRISYISHWNKFIIKSEEFHFSDSLVTQRLDLNHEKLDLIHAKRDLTNIKLDLAHAMLDLAHAELDLALEIIKRNPHKVKLDQCKVRCPSKMANNMLNLKIDPNLVVFSLHCKSLSGTVDSWQPFCNF